MSIDKQLWGKAWTTEVVVRVNSSWNNLRIDGTSVNGTYTFSDIGGDKKYDLENAFDICGKNIYWAVYDKQVDKKLTPVMWDLDCTMGQNFTDDPLHPEYVVYNCPLRNVNIIFYRMEQLDAAQFTDAVRQRYGQLRENVFSTQSLQSRYIDVYNTLADCGAARREEQRWSYDTDIAGLRLDLKAELNYICHWINNRMQFLDNQFLHSLSAIEHPQAPSTPVDK
jgi:hypothetical protein